MFATLFSFIYSITDHYGRHQVYMCVQCNRQTKNNMHKRYYYWASGIQHCMPSSVVTVVVVVLLLMIFTMYVCVMSHKFYFCVLKSFTCCIHCSSYIVPVMHITDYCLLSSQVSDCVLCLTCMFVDNKRINLCFVCFILGRDA